MNLSLADFPLMLCMIIVSCFVQALSYDLPGVSSSSPGNQPTTGGTLVSLAGRNFGTQDYSGASRVSGNQISAPSNVNGGIYQCTGSSPFSAVRISLSCLQSQIFIRFS